LEVNQWERWRLIYGGWEIFVMNIHIDSDHCEMKLLAKDGIYIKDFPRRIGKTDIPSGGRADVMIRCSKEGTYDLSDERYKIGSVTVIKT